jgi:hypothetical protein
MTATRCGLDGSTAISGTEAEEAAPPALSAWTITPSDSGCRSRSDWHAVSRARADAQISRAAVPGFFGVDGMRALYFSA